MADAERAVERAAQSLGYPDLKKEQKEAMIKFISGRDVFVSLPTGFGKTVCYAALPMAFDHLLGRDSSDPSARSVAVVVSPLLSLIRDQVDSLSSKGLRVGYINSETDEDERRRVYRGMYQIVYFSPESLLYKSHWRKVLHEEVYYNRIVAFVVDEAHCVKKWLVHGKEVCRCVGGGCTLSLIYDIAACIGY